MFFILYFTPCPNLSFVSIFSVFILYILSYRTSFRTLIRIVFAAATITAASAVTTITIRLVVIAAASATMTIVFTYVVMTKTMGMIVVAVHNIVVYLFWSGARFGACTAPKCGRGYVAFAMN